MKKYLDILGIGYGLSKEEINKAYKKMAMKYHPDRNHGFKEEAEKKMKALNEARDYVLANFDEYNNYMGESYQEEEKKEEKKTESNYKNTESKREEKVVDNEKIKRLKKVLFFVGLVLVPFIAGWIGIDNSDSADIEWYIFNFITYFIPYIILADLVKRISSYINNGKNEGYIPNKFYKWLLYFIILIVIFGLMYFVYSENLKKEEEERLKNIEIQCVSNGGKIGESGSCECEEGFIMGEDGRCKKDIKIYDDGEISFKYPGKLLISNKEFEDFKFFENENINVKKYNFNSITDYCLSGLKSRLKGELDGTMGDGEGMVKTKKEADNIFFEKKNIYMNYINLIKTGKINDLIRAEISEEPTKLDYKTNSFDHFSCFATKGSINLTPININGINGIIINYYFTQDEDMACLTQFNTELLLVKDFDNIYSIMFKNNFGQVFDYLQQYKGEYGEACLSYSELDSYKGENASKTISDFYKYGNSLQGTEYESFENNYKIIKEIINTVKFK